MAIDLLNTPIAELTNVDITCSCGKNHSIHIGTIDISRNASDHVADIARPYFERGPILVVCDVNTHAVLGKKVHEQLLAAGADADCYIYPEKHLHPDAFAVGRLLIEATDERRKYGLLIAVGSGTLNDITRLVSGRVGLPYFIVGTAPSMDGYAGNSSPIVCRDTKMSFYSHYADAIIADTTVMAQAPAWMLAAGLGDVMGKYVALADWKMDEDLKGAYRCELISNFMANAVEKCAATAEAVARRDPDAIGTMMEALTMSGMAMGLATVTRPASGCEHHMAHYVDIDLISRGMDYPLHGNTVGITALAMLRFYEMARRDGLTDLETPSADTVREMIERIGGPVRPSEIGVDAELFRRAMLEAKELRPQYSMLKLAYDNGKLEEYTEIVMKEMFN